ncbi:Lymphocyte antigen 6 complex locus protein G6d, partial [Lemmus lemmus]
RCFPKGQSIPLSSCKLHLFSHGRHSLQSGVNTPVSFFLPASMVLSQHHPACVATHHCNQVDIESVGGVTFTTHKNCCFGDLCNGAVASSVTPFCILAAAVTTLVWLLPGL